MRTSIVSIYQESKEVIALQERGNMSISTIETLAAFFFPVFTSTGKPSPTFMFAWSLESKKGCTKL